MKTEFTVEEFASLVALSATSPYTGEDRNTRSAISKAKFLCDTYDSYDTEVWVEGVQVI